MILVPRRICSKCKKPKASSAFVTNGKSWCKKCQNQSTEIWRNRHRAEFKRRGGPSVTKKICRMCKEEKPAKMFRVCPQYKDGLTYYCRACLKTSDRQSQISRGYGITYTEFQAMFKAQRGLCKICQKPMTIASTKKERTSAQIDHSHRTGKVRGLLCWTCNLWLRVFESTTGPFAADFIAYLKSYGENITWPKEEPFTRVS